MIEDKNMDVKTYLDLIAAECISELESIGFTVSSDVTFEIDYRSKRRAGVCIKGKNIKISRFIFRCSEAFIKDVIMHEIIHTFPGCNNHKYYWKRNAEIVNRKLGRHIVTRFHQEFVKNTYDDETYDIIYNSTQSEKRYILKCNKCGSTTLMVRLGKRTLNSYKGNKLICMVCNNKDFSLFDKKLNNYISK